MDRDGLTQRIRQRLSDLSIPQAEVARRTGWPPNFLSDLLHGRKKSVRPDNMRRLAAALETTTDFLRGMTDDPSLATRNGELSGGPQGYRFSGARGLALVALPFHSRPVLDRELLSNWRDQQPEQGRGRVPFFVEKSGRRAGSVTLGSNLPSAALTVPAVAGLQGAYAVLMPDDSMRPAWPAGWAVYAAPRAVVPGTNVVVRMTDRDRPLFLVRHLTDFSEEHIAVSSLVDGRVEVIERHQFSSVHPVVALMADPEIL